MLRRDRKESKVNNLVVTFIVLLNFQTKSFYLRCSYLSHLSELYGVGNNMQEIKEKREVFYPTILLFVPSKWKYHILLML